jgi:hypothetical protein
VEPSTSYVQEALQGLMERLRQVRAAAAAEAGLDRAWVAEERRLAVAVAALAAKLAPPATAAEEDPQQALEDYLSGKTSLR